MLRNLGIRWQILSALALPVLVLGLISSQVTYQALLDMRDANQSRQFAQAGSGLAVVIDGLATERALSDQVLLGASGALPQLKAGRASVDRQLAVIRAEVYGNGSNDVAVQHVLARLAAVNALIPALRTDVDAGKTPPRAIAARYTQIIAADVRVPFDLADTLADHGQATNFRNAGQLGIAIEALAEEQLTGGSAIASGQLGALDQQDLGAAEAAGGQAISDYLRTATAAQRALLLAALAAPAARTADLANARAALASSGASRPPNLSVTDWVAISAGQIKAIQAVYDRISADGVALANTNYNSARQKLQLTLGGALGITLLTLLLALGLSRRVAAPLRRLTLAATQIRDELPRLVASLKSEEDFELHLPVVSTAGRNEVSQLAAAFVDVNAVTVQIAREQARLRSAVGDMFVNVARRNQVLLARQLAFIDQLERNEVNPDALEELFRLDHLATRMRRNAESLLVLAGIESGRRLREPMPLSDVVRTATSEIEHYSRVSLSLAIDPPLFAHLALPVAHLLAELLENATNFSDPGSTVVVMATLTEHGVRMTVADDGLGMSAAELGEINARIDEPPTPEALSSQRLGFFVVGRLAQRLDAKVTLTSGRSRGTAVLIDLPTALFIPGAIDKPGYPQPAALGQPAELPALPSQHSVPRQPEFPARTSEPAGISAGVQADIPAGVLAGLPVGVPAGISAGSPFVDAYSMVPTPAAASAAVALESIPVLPSIPAPSAPVIPAALNVEALVADAAAEPVWMPQPDALPDGTLPAVLPIQDVVAAPLTRRGAGPAAAVPAPAPGPVFQPEAAPLVPVAPVAAADPVPAGSEWAASEWATSEWAEPAAPAWAASEWAVPEQAQPVPISAEPQIDVQPPSQPQPAPPAAGPSLFSGFRSRREAQAPPATEAGPVEPLPPSSLQSEQAPIAEFVAAEAELRFITASSFADPTPPADEWYEAPALSNPDSDRWQAWAEVSAANAGSGERPAAEGEDEGDEYIPEVYTPEVWAPESYSAEAYPTEAYQTESYSTEAYPAEVFQTDAYSPDAYSPDTYSPDVHSTDPSVFPPELYPPEPHSAPQSLAPTETETGNSEPGPRRPAPGGELRGRTLTAAIDILPQRTSIRTALRRGRRKTDIVGANLPFNGGFDPIVLARDFARREGFAESAPAGPATQTDAEPEIPQQAGPSGQAPAAQVERRQHQRPGDGSDGTAGRSALASEALTELSRLSSYSPTSMPASTAPSLQRRPPSETPSDEPAPAAEASGERTRTAASVRSMLAGFKAGVERGRTSPSANRPAGERESGSLPQPRKAAGRDE